MNRNKAELRRLARNLRYTTSNESGVVLEAVLGLLAGIEFADSDYVLAYEAAPGEIDLSALKSSLDNLAVTRCVPDSFELTVHPWNGQTELNRFGITQPVSSAPVVARDDIKAVLVPGLAFDLQGNRLGHGLGFYDRFLATLNASVVLIGIVNPAEMLLRELPSEHHDIAMTHLVVGERVIII